jgi:hypothetical protein
MDTAWHRTVGRAWKKHAELWVPGMESAARGREEGSWDIQREGVGDIRGAWWEEP